MVERDVLAATAFVGVATALLWVIWNRKRTFLPRGYRRVEPVSVAGRVAEADPTRDNYKTRKVPADLDHVVIGSGIGGMYTAALLASVGRKVLVLEQHYVAGGCTHEFEDKGFSWDTGVHYVGRAEKYGAMLDMVIPKALQVKWAKLGTEENGYVYDEIEVKGLAVHRFRAGKQAFVEDLVARFPGERAAVEEYLRLCKQINKAGDIWFFGKLFSPWLDRLLRRFAGGSFAKLAGKTQLEVLQTLTSNKELIAVLCGQFGDFGLPPGKGSFFMAAGITMHYLQGAYYPEGGTQTISRGMVRTIEAAGGRVLVRAEVAQILVDEYNRCTGVRLAGGDEIRPRLGVISAAGYSTTYGKLLPKTVKSAPLKGVETLKPGISHLYAFIGFEGTAEELGLEACNRWVLPAGPDLDLDRMCEEYYAAPFDSEPLMFVGFPSAKDPTWAQRFPGKSTCVIITEGKAEWFAEHRDEPQGSRSAEYQRKKDVFRGKLLEGLHQRWPATRGAVRYCEIATPLTNEFFLGHEESYGLEHTPERYTKATNLRPQTEIQGLYLAGQEVATAGVAGAMMGGVLTAHAVLGYTALDMLVFNRNLITDIMNLKGEALAARVPPSP